MIPTHVKVHVEHVVLPTANAMDIIRPQLHLCFASRIPCFIVVHAGPAPIIDVQVVPSSLPGASPSRSVHLIRLIELEVDTVLALMDVITDVQGEQLLHTIVGLGLVVVRREVLAHPPVRRVRVALRPVQVLLVRRVFHPLLKLIEIQILESSSIAAFLQNRTLFFVEIPVPVYFSAIILRDQLLSQVVLLPPPFRLRNSVLPETPVL